MELDKKMGELMILKQALLYWLRGQVLLFFLWQ